MAQVVDPARVPAREGEVFRGQGVELGLPDQRNAASLKTLESALELTPGTLTVFIKQYRSRAQHQDTSISESNWSVTGQVPENLRLRRPRSDEIPLTVKTAWQSLLADHVRTGGRPKQHGESGSGAGWEVVRRFDGEKPAPWFASFHGSYCSTAARHWNTVLSFFGYLSTDAATQMLGISKDESITLAWLCNPEACSAYANFLIDRAGGQVNANAKAFYGLVALLGNEKSGWFRERELDFRPTLPARYRALDWQSSCADAIETTAEIILTHDEAVRDWDVFLSEYTKHQDPATPVLEAISTLIRESEVLRVDSPERARLLRDAAVLSFILLLPLRVRTLSEVEYGTQSKHIVFRGDEMRVALSSKMFKNGKKRGPLKANVEGELVHIIKRYVDEARPILCRGIKSPWLFISSRNPERPWRLISVQVKQITTRLCERGIPVHLFRHLVALRFLRQHPKDYLGVASLLHDSIETVLARYAPKDPTAAFSKNSSSLRLLSTPRP